MRASQFEFRFRVVIMLAIISLGFWSPWIQFFGLGRRTSLLEWLALEISRTGLLSFTAATPAVIAFASALAALAAVLRITGAAWLSPAVVNHMQMQAGSVMAGGPFRYVRNPLYLGTWLMIAAVSFVMPVSGAIFTDVLIAVFVFRLILAEENFLSKQVGEPYWIYLRAVPRLFPRLRSALPAAQQRGHWGTALLSETNAIGVVVILAGLSWRYDNALMVRAILINYGISLVLRALLPSANRQVTPAA